LAELIREGRARLIGPIRQELLSGIRREAQYERLRSYLRAFPDPQLTEEDYEEAASANNRCQTKGVSGSAVDLLICAVGMRRNWRIFTTDRDFLRYAKILSIQLHTARTHT
jgi:predicted nucleic acid-binding protein